MALGGLPPALLNDSLLGTSLVGVFLDVIYGVPGVFLSAFGKRDLLFSDPDFAPTAGGLKSRITVPLSVGCLGALKTCIFFF